MDLGFCGAQRHPLFPARATGFRGSVRDVAHGLNLAVAAAEGFSWQSRAFRQSGLPYIWYFGILFSLIPNIEAMR